MSECMINNLGRRGCGMSGTKEREDLREEKEMISRKDGSLGEHCCQGCQQM